jgi:hypothetical protein
MGNYNCRCALFPPSWDIQGAGNEALVRLGVPAATVRKFTGSVLYARLTG